MVSWVLYSFWWGWRGRCWRFSQWDVPFRLERREDDRRRSFGGERRSLCSRLLRGCSVRHVFVRERVLSLEPFPLTFSSSSLLLWLFDRWIVDEWSFQGRLGRWAGLIWGIGWSTICVLSRAFALASLHGNFKLSVENDIQPFRNRSTVYPVDWLQTRWMAKCREKRSRRTCRGSLLQKFPLLQAEFSNPPPGKNHEQESIQNSAEMDCAPKCCEYSYS